MDVKWGPYSPSRLETAKCPLRFLKEYIEKSAGDTSSPASRRGNVVHDVNEQITLGWMHDKPLNWEDVRNLLTKKIGEYGVVDEEAINVCIRAARTYMENPVSNIGDIVGTEEMLAVKWDSATDTFVECEWDDPKCYGRGKIDILQIKGDVATIVDHKTQLNITAADTFQMGFYAWLVTKFYPFLKEVNTVLHFCHPDLNRYSKPFPWSREEIDDVEEQIRIRVAGIESMADFYAEPGGHCTYCAIQLECPKVEELNKKRVQYGKVKGAPIVDASQAVEIAKVLTVTDLGRTTLNTRLREFAKEIGPVQLDGIKYGYFPSESWQVKSGKAKEIFEILEESGVDPFEVFKCDVRTLQKSWRVFKKPLIERIKDRLEIVAKTSFRSKKS